MQILHPYHLFTFILSISNSIQCYRKIKSQMVYRLKRIKKTVLVARLLYAFPIVVKALVVVAVAVVEVVVGVVIVVVVVVGRSSDRNRCSSGDSK